MISTAVPIPLSRKLVTWYLAFGLAGLFLCLITTIFFEYRGNLLDWLGIAAILPVTALAAGAWALHQMSRLHSQIELQLQRLSTQPVDSKVIPEWIPGNDPAALGWNSLISRLEMGQSLAQLESRLSGKFSGRRDSRPMLIVHTLTDAIALTEQDGRILVANRALAGMAGVAAAEDLIGKNVVEVLQEMGLTLETPDMQILQSAGSQVVIELHRSEQIQDGVWRVSRQISIDAESPLTRFVWSIRDITQQLLVEDSRKQFLAVATHELRTPLANIKAYAETLAIHEGIDVESQKEFCNIINEEVTRLGRFVDEMLSISQMESGAMTLDMANVEFDRLVQEVIDHSSPLMTQKNIALEVSLPPKFPRMQLDKEKIHAALVNLLGNAAKYTPEGGRVWLKLEVQARSVEISIRDSGIGIAAEELNRVFDRFFRSADSRVRDIPGNGIGLAFTQEVIQLHGGEITVESEFNQGTDFKVRLPLRSGGSE